MKKIIASLTFGAGLTIMTGCATIPPTYELVQGETDTVLQQVADLIPEPKSIDRNEEFQPYPCDDPLTFGGEAGSFYTGQWMVFVDDSFDIPAFITKFPEALGAGWRSAKLGVPVAHPQVYLVSDSPQMSLTIEETTFRDRKAVELLAISRCGTLPATPAP